MTPSAKLVIWLRRVALWLFWPALALVVWGELEPGADAEIAVWDKALHFIAYFGLAGIATVALRARRTALYAIIALVAIGGALEIIQGIVGRDSDIYDEVANTFGALVGGGMAWGFLALIGRLLPHFAQNKLAPTSEHSMLEEFKKFAIRGNVVDLAVGVIIGAAFTGIVNSLVKDLFTPPLGMLLGGFDFANFFITLKGEHYNTLAEAQKAGAVTLNYGLFLNTIINFMFVAFAMFLVVRAVNRLRAEPPPAEPAATPEEVLLLRDIRDSLKARP
jgi:large conductance mechanosensitive channel